MNQSPTKFDSPSKQHSSWDRKLRKNGVPVALKRSTQFPILDSFMISYFHTPAFAEQILQYDDSIINEEGVTALLQKLFIQLIYCKKKDTSAVDVYTCMKVDYNTRYKNTEEFLTRFLEKVDDAISKYRTILNELVEEHPIRDLFIGKYIKESTESTFNLIKLELEEESILEGLQNKFSSEDCSIKELPKILQFEIRKKKNLILLPTIYLDQFMFQNKGTIKQHQDDIKKLKMTREEIVQKIRNLESYQQTGQSIPQILQTTIDLIQEQRNELLDGDPAIEGLIQLIMDVNQELSQLKEELSQIDQQIKLIMGSFNKIEYNLYAVIIYDGDYECVFVKNLDHSFFFEDGYAEVRKGFDIEMQQAPDTVVYLLYQDKNLTSDFSFTGGQGNLLDMDTRKPYEQLLRKELQKYAEQFNQQVDQELYIYKQQQQADEVYQQYQNRFNFVFKLVQRKHQIQVPILTNFASYLCYSQRKIDDFVKWQILDCSIKDVTGFSLQDTKNTVPFAQKLRLLFQNQPQKSPTNLNISKQDMQIMQVKLSDYVQFKQSTAVLIHAIQSILQEKHVNALNSLRVIYEFSVRNILLLLSQEILKAYMMRLCNLAYKTHQSQQYADFWDYLQWIMTYWIFLFQDDLVHQQIYIMVKDIKNKANKKALNSDQLKIVKKYLTAVKDKKLYEIGTNFLLKKDPELENITQIDWGQEHYYWTLDNQDDISFNLLNTIQYIQQNLQLEFQIVKQIIQQKCTFSYEDRTKLQFHCPL